jgi:hypothetical protein
MALKIEGEERLRLTKALKAAHGRRARSAACYKAGNGLVLGARISSSRSGVPSMRWSEG